MTLPVPGSAAVPVSPATGAALALNDTDKKLIMELVAGISTPAEIIQRYGLTKADLGQKFKDKMFRASYSEAKRTWDSDLNVYERVKWKSAMLLEDSLIELARIIQNENMSAAAKRDAIETLGKLSDAWEPGKRKDGGATPANVKISINLGSAPQERVLIEGSAVATENADG